ncbi:hypothetical protein [Singulisphaera sp. PoT]|uniref:hypothetical protein n=1 Tax=Singulisphaera sp. PoT TaxID=3411797 RepID=UPI003BF5861D
MLNRTNRTLSANLNGLNLGTRSLATLAGLNNGASTLRTRHVHRVVKRDEMQGYQPMPITIGHEVIIPISSSSPVLPPVTPSSPVVRTRVDADVPFTDSDTDSGRTCRYRDVRGHSPELSWQGHEGSKRGSRAIKRGWLQLLGNDLGERLALAATLAPAAAVKAAAGG